MIVTGTLNASSGRSVLTCCHPSLSFFQTKPTRTPRSVMTSRSRNTDASSVNEFLRFGSIEAFATPPKRVCTTPSSPA